MNTLTYTLQLNDKMSSILKKVGATTDSTTQDVRELKSEVGSLNNVNLSGFFSSISKIAGVLGIGATIGKTIKSGMEQEMRNTSFDVLFGGTDNAKKMIDDISGYAAKSPYGKVGLSEATQMMAGFGIAQEKIMPNLKMIGNIAMGNEQKFNSLTLAFSQMSSTGKLTGQDLMQMINAGFNPLEQMAKTTGKSIGTLKEEMSKGAISAQMVSKAFQDATSEGGLYNGMIDKISNTASGQWATAMDNLAEKMLNLYDNVIQPLLLPALKLFNQFLEDPIGAIGRLVDKVTTAYPIILGAIIGISAAFIAYKAAILSVTVAHAAVAVWKSILGAYQIVVFAVKNATSLWTAAQWLLNVALGANPIGIVIAGVVALISVITFLIVKIDGWGNLWQHTINGCKLIFRAYVESVKFYFNTMVNALMIGLNTIKKGWYEFKEAVGIGDSSENQKMLAQISADTEARKKAITDGAKNIVDLGIQAKNEFAAAANSLSWSDTSFSDVAQSIKNKLGISSPGIPGTENAAAVAGGGDVGGSNFGGSAGKDTANSIATGGTKTTHITVNVGEMGNDMKIFVSDAREGASKIRDMIVDELTRVLSMAQSQV